MKPFALALLALLAIAPAARAADEQSCDAAAFEVAGRFAGFPDFKADNDARVASAACKAVPGQPGVLLAAFAFDTQPAGKPAREDDARDLVVLMIDRAQHRVIASHRQHVEEDAMTHFGSGSLRLDTARYQLAPDVRAFGLRFESDARGASCADNAFGTLLTLFVPDGRTLRPVLRMNMSTNHALSGCVGSAVDGSVVESAEMTIAIAPERSHGFADLAVSARIATHAADVGRKVPGPRTETRTLHYDGRRYPVREGDAWWLADLGF